MFTKYDNAIMTKVRAMYGKMLTPSQYEELIHKHTVQEISAYLRDETPYGAEMEWLKDSQVHRGQLENLVRKEEFYQYTRLMKYERTKNSIYNFVIMDDEIDVILSCLRYLISGRSEEFVVNVPSFIGPYTSFNLFSLAAVRTIDDLIRALSTTPYAKVIQRCRMLKTVNGQIDYTSYEVALRTYYFQTMLDWIKKNTYFTTRRQLTEIINRQAELLNITSIYRAKTFFQMSPSKIEKLMLPFEGKIKKKTLSQLIHARDEGEFLQLMSQTAYGKQIHPKTEFIENAVHAVRYECSKKYLRFSQNPQVVFVSFMLMCSVEVENIIRIIEGVRYQLAPEEISRMLYIY